MGCAAVLSSTDKGSMTTGVFVIVRQVCAGVSALRDLTLGRLLNLSEL